MGPWFLHEMVDVGDGHCDYCSLTADEHIDRETLAYEYGDENRGIQAGDNNA